MDQDLDAVAKKQFRGGSFRPPVIVAELVDRLTCRQFVGLFWEPAGRTSGGNIDPLDEITVINRERGCKGLKPVVPTWMVT